LTVYMQAAIALGPKFDIYMQQIHKPILTLIDIDVKMVETTTSKSDHSKSGIIKVDIDLKLLGGKKLLSLNIIALQIK